MKRRVPIIVLCVCALIFVLGLLRLFHLRFEQGDVYPPYSSLRADPLGTMALYESLECLPEMVVRRDFSARNQLPESRNTTYFHLAADAANWSWMPESTVMEIESFLARGGRLVITCEPVVAGPDPFPSPRSRLHGSNAPADGPVKSPQDKPGDRADPQSPRDKAGNLFEKQIDLQKRWGFEVDYGRMPTVEKDAANPVDVTNQLHPMLPPSLAWHSATLFKDLAPSWKVVYARGSNAVVMERRFGTGSVVMAGDSFFVSNEALLIDRHAGLLAWLVGSNRTIVFDEAHLGVVEEPGVATLMRRYRLHGLVAGLALVMGLFVWKNSFSLVPPGIGSGRRDHVAGRDSAQGFVNLLRRSIPPADVLKVCYEQWEKSRIARRDLTLSRIQLARQSIEAELARSASDRDPVAAYQQVSRILKPGRSETPATPPTESKPS